MDLWAISINFLCSRVTGETYLLSDVIGLGYKWGVPIRSRPTGGALGSDGSNQEIKGPPSLTNHGITFLFL